MIDEWVNKDVSRLDRKQDEVIVSKQDIVDKIVLQIVDNRLRL
jgi:hypothetical protein